MSSSDFKKESVSSPRPKRRLEFRIPISPTATFFTQVHLFNFALRRLGGVYQDAELTVVVGDHCDLDAVRRENRWSEAHPITWNRVPDRVFDEFNIWGTANWRLCMPSTGADVVILSDADTVLVRDIDPLIESLPLDVPAVRGHMAHVGPPTGVGPQGSDPSFWPYLFSAFDLEWPPRTYPYSMDEAGELPLAPAYFNLGFVAMNALALPLFGAGIAEAERRIKALTESRMRCQIAVTLLSHQAKMDVDVLPAEYNVANDLKHFTHNNLNLEDCRVIHYLRLDEVDRASIFLPSNIEEFLRRDLLNPVNIALQDVVADFYAEVLTKESVSGAG